MVLYDDKSWGDGSDYTEQGLQSAIAAAYVDTDEAMYNSKIDLTINLVHVGRVSAGDEEARPHRTWYCCFYATQAMCVVLYGKVACTSVV